MNCREQTIRSKKTYLQQDKTCYFIHRNQRINYTDGQCVHFILIKLLLITVRWQRGMNYANNDCLSVCLSIYPVLLLLKVHYKKGRKVHTLLGMGSCKQYTWGRMVEPVTPHQAGEDGEREKRTNQGTDKTHAVVAYKCMESDRKESGVAQCIMAGEQQLWVIAAQLKDSLGSPKPN